MITIDGPAASGKSTTARGVADALGFCYLDTGAMYRASAFLVLKAGIDPSDCDSVAKLLQDHEISIEEGSLFLDSEEITTQIRSRTVGETASIVSTHKKVRRHMVSLQRAFALIHNTVAEGRDMGTVVFPYASLKVYVVADFAVRVFRRLKDYNSTDTELVAHSLFLRDYRDRNRAESPLRLPPGAVWLDGTGISVSQQINRVLEHYERSRLS